VAGPERTYEPTCAPSVFVRQALLYDVQRTESRIGLRKYRY
jgi:hypothetical protein